MILTEFETIIIAAIKEEGGKCAILDIGPWKTAASVELQHCAEKLDLRFKRNRCIIYLHGRKLELCEPCFSICAKDLLDPAWSPTTFMKQLTDFADLGCE